MSEAMMQRTQPSPSALLDEMVTDVRNRGYTRASALVQVADWCGLRVRRAKKLVYGEVEVRSERERRAILDGRIRHLQREAELYRERLERVRAELTQLDSGL